MSMIESVYREHYAAVRKRLIGKPSKSKLIDYEPQAEKINMSLAKCKVWQEVQDEKKRQYEERQKQIADAITIASSRYAPVILRESTRKIKKRIAEKHGVTVRDIDGIRRFHVLIAARDEAIAEVHRIWPEKGYCEIGRIFNKDHSSIIHSLQKSGVYTPRSDGIA